MTSSMVQASQLVRAVAAGMRRREDLACCASRRWNGMRSPATPCTSAKPCRYTSGGRHRPRRRRPCARGGRSSGRSLRHLRRARGPPGTRARTSSRSPRAAAAQPRWRTGACSCAPAHPHVAEVELDQQVADLGVLQDLHDAVDRRFRRCRRRSRPTAGGRPSSRRRRAAAWSGRRICRKLRNSSGGM